MRHHSRSCSRVARCAATAALAALSITVLPGRADGQIDRLRRARERVTSTPSLNSLFGDEPSITTSLEDARDGVPAMDGFEPEAFSPMAEMPKGPGGYVLLAPGAYAFHAQSFCLRAGTYAPGGGAGYLHAPLKGPKAELISAIIGRAADEPGIEQRDVQELLWAVLARAKPSQMRHSMQLTAARLLTPGELAELDGYALGVVPDALRRRVLQTVPAPARRVLEAENQMRRLLGSSDTRFEDLERVAVLTGTIPPGEEGEPLPVGRWSFHPNGFFIRYEPGHYTAMRVEVYYPVSVEIERDVHGRIVNVRTPDGSWVGAEYGNAPSISFAAGDGGRVQQDLEAIRFAGGAGGPHPSSSVWRPEAGVGIQASRWTDAARRAGGLEFADAVDLARADVEDLAFLGAIVDQEVAPRPGAEASAAVALVRGAIHTALARYYGELSQRSSRADAVRAPVRTSVSLGLGLRSRYTIVAGITGAYDGASVAQHPGALRPIQPGSGAAVPPGARQRLAPSARPADDDAQKKARRIVGAMSGASDGLGLATDPAGFFGGLIPSAIFGAGLDWAFDTSREISDAMQGDTGGGDDGAMLDPLPLEPGPTPARPWGVGGAPFARRVSLGGVLTGAAPRLPADRGRQERRSVSKPRTVELPPIPASADVTPEHAAAIDAVLQQTFRVGAVLEAVLTTQERFTQAAAVQDSESENIQALALVYLKREAGQAMQGLADDLVALRSVAGSDSAAVVGEEGFRQAEMPMGAEGTPREAIEVARTVGLPAGWAGARQARLSRMSPAQVADGWSSSLQTLIDELRSYGSYWASLPVVPKPWVDDGAPGG